MINQSRPEHNQNQSFYPFNEPHIIQQECLVQNYRVDITGEESSIEKRDEMLNLRSGKIKEKEIVCSQEAKNYNCGKFKDKLYRSQLCTARESEISKVSGGNEPTKGQLEKEDAQKYLGAASSNTKQEILSVAQRQITSREENYRFNREGECRCVQPDPAQTELLKDTSVQVKLRKPTPYLMASQLYNVYSTALSNYIPNDLD